MNNKGQTGLRLCCSHATKSGFLVLMPISDKYGNLFETFNVNDVEWCLYSLQLWLASYLFIRPNKKNTCV